MNRFLKCHQTILLTCLLLLTIGGLKAQEQNRLFFGGNVSIGISDYLNIDVSPRVGYYLTPLLAMGILAKYEYLSFDQDGYEPFKENTYGGGAFAQYDISSLFLGTHMPYNIFVHTEYQYLYTETNWKRENYTTGYRTDDKWYIGGGFSVFMGGNTRFYTYVSYDILRAIKNEGNKYNKPVVSVGIQF